MAPVLADPNGAKSTKSRKVRIIGKIRGFADKESESLSQSSKQWITVKNLEENGASEKCKVIFNTQSSSGKDGYELDYCYGQHEEIDQIYSREIQPMILEAFDGRNASVIALGARGSGKTHTIQGSLERPGLAVIAMSEILSRAKEVENSVYVSLYELTQEHVKDLLNPGHSAIQVLEDAQGKINIKGLSKVPVKSITEFYDIYFTRGSSQNPQKMPIDQPHKGLMVHLSSDDDKMKEKLAIKINFVDLAGYEDLRRSNRDGVTPVESNRKNKSFYALLNVVSAINAKEIRLPYRESKLTRILQDSLGDKSNVLLLTCLNSSSCQDSLSIMSLVSRSYRSTKPVLTDSTNRRLSSAKAKELSLLENGKIISASSIVKKQIGHSRLLSAKKVGSVLRGRKLANDVKMVNSEQLRCHSEDTSLLKSRTLPSPSLDVTPLSLEEQVPQDNPVVECSSVVEAEENEGPRYQSVSKLEKDAVSNLEITLLPDAINDEPTAIMKEDVSPHNGMIHNLGDTPGVTLAGSFEENELLNKKHNGSLPLSARIREVYNNLKAVCESTPLTIKIPEDAAVPYNSQVDNNDIMEPKTPAMELKSAKYFSPRGSFSNRSSRMKDSLVQDYLGFLNSANKEELKSLKGIGEKRATYILQMREDSPEPFKSLDHLQDIGLSAKQIKGMMKQVAGGLFD